MSSFFVTIPHSGEFVPQEATWLKNLAEPLLMRDVDRYVDHLYVAHLQQLKVPFIVAECHRYVIDLNRLESEYDSDAVVSAPWPRGKHPKGLHWSVTTLGEPLMSSPMSHELHETFVRLYYRPFHEQVHRLAQTWGEGPIFHIDAHSMPSQGTALHNDPGEKRADVVVSDFHGQSARKDFVDLIIAAYEQAGFKVAYNWPYFGGGITQMYGKPNLGHHTVQVELNRALYMDESTKKKSAQFEETRIKIGQALQTIQQQLSYLKK